MKLKPIYTVKARVHHGSYKREEIVAAQSVKEALQAIALTPMGVGYLPKPDSDQFNEVCADLQTNKKAQWGWADFTLERRHELTCSPTVAAVKPLPAKLDDGVLDAAARILADAAGVAIEDAPGHTPLKWVVSSSTMVVREDGKLIALCHSFDGLGVSFERAAKNARLIAAAPDLFQALAVLVSLREHPLSVATTERAYENARAALKRAKETA